MKLFTLVLASLTVLVAGAPPDADKAKMLGQANAPIAIEVFSSFACSHCKDFHERILPQLIKDYVNTGKACVISRETFPATWDAAREAANTATAAGRVGKYQQVAEALFKSQAVWSQGGRVWDYVAPVLTPEEQKKVQLLAKDAAIAGEVHYDLELAAKQNITSTPTLIVHTKTKTYPPMPGVPEYSLLKSLLDSLSK
jgi:protein-disulfide isomerase